MRKLLTSKPARFFGYVALIAVDLAVFFVFVVGLFVTSMMTVKDCAILITDNPELLEAVTEDADAHFKQSRGKPLRTSTVFLRP